jgi:ABC-type cobalt transport system substrate-binding protein
VHSKQAMLKQLTLAHAHLLLVNLANCQRRDAHDGEDERACKVFMNTGYDPLDLSEYEPTEGMQPCNLTYATCEDDTEDADASTACQAGI